MRITGAAIIVAFWANLEHLFAPFRMHHEILHLVQRHMTDDTVECEAIAAVGLQVSFEVGSGIETLVAERASILEITAAMFSEMEAQS